MFFFWPLNHLRKQRCEAQEFEPNTMANPLLVGGVQFDVSDAICSVPHTRNNCSRTHKKSCV
jgi:hypothetical protein